MNGFFSGAWLITSLELRQRVRGAAWYVLLGVFMFVILCVTVLLVLATNAWENGGGGVFSTIIFFVLLLATLVSPALSGNAINGERDAGTLATTQVTLITTGQLVFGKWLAAWITALGFLAGALPFLIFAVALGQVSAATVAVSVLVLAVELAIIAAFGVGLSGVITRPLFSIVVTYLVIAALSIGTLIAFGLAGAATRSTSTTIYHTANWGQTDQLDPQTGQPDPLLCTETTTSTTQVPRFDYYWPILAANPYVILADGSPAIFDEHGTPRDLFTVIAVGVRSLQHAPDLHSEYSDCEQPQIRSETAKQIYDDSVPSWFVGLGIQLLLGLGALFWAWKRTATPSHRLPTGSRIA